MTKREHPVASRRTAGQAMARFTGVTPRFPVTDLRRTIDFYRGHPGFDVEVSWPDQRPTFAILCRDETSLGFFEPTEHQPGRLGYAELYIQVTDSLAVHDSVSGVIPIEWGPDVFSYGRREFALRDPDHYLVIITEPTSDAPTTNEPKG